ncbi:MAG: hypothetical protein IKB49_02235 [Alphaproteobacteria bacterium]|nr:hypothetical protein [Alphaproteobacteria bacterium]
MQFDWMTRFVIILSSLFLLINKPALANTVQSQPAENEITLADYLEREPDQTECATAAFADALAANASQISADAYESDVRLWINTVFAAPATLDAVLACPELQNTPDTQAIKFMPIMYTFPNGREIVINYETQPKILKQRRTLGNKRELPTDGNANPRIGATGDDSIWTYTDPAWYAIMITEHGALDEFAGPGKNNTISMDYIRDNIDDLYPSGYNCSDKSAKSRDITMIHRATKQTVGLADAGEKDSNDYYIAGDVNLQWLSYLEIALDVALTVVTVGGSQAVTGVTKAVRASRSLKTLSQSLRGLRTLDSVRDYIRLSNQLDNAKDALKKLDRITDAAEYRKKSREIDNLTDRMRQMERTDDNVKKFKQQSETFQQLNQYRHQLQALRGRRTTGNIITRGWRTLRAVNSGGKQLNNAAKLARSARIGRTSTLSGRVRDWLFQSTMSNIGALGKLAATGTLISGALKFIGGMYDWTETSTGEYTSGVDFAPLLLLSADDLQGQENVVNHGMWLLWSGSSTSPSDDDAAYLQATDFASKLHQDLYEMQNDTASPCNVDIWVVRPVLRNPQSETPQLYYLIMNDQPWTTADK